MATSTRGGGGSGSGSGSGKGSSSREGTAKAMVADQITQAIVSTSNLLHLMQQSSPSQVLEQMPQVISSLDAHMEHGLQSLPHLKTVSQLLGNMESCQLSAFSQAQKEAELANQSPKVD